ncbi:MAG: protein-tyrosine phosphatase [Thermoleophilaceae bacterium]|nr:protein-tyrosine phosphatase [Thermoleophilaceae bacterium]
MSVPASGASVRLGMIDLHTHVLPGIDDGPDDMVGTVAMAEVAAASGTRTLVATPHVRDDHPRVVIAEIQERAREVNRRVRDYGIDVFVVPGGEVALASAVALSDDELELVTLGGNGRDLLIETPYEGIPSVFEELLAQIAGRGFRVTLAHPELNPTFQRDPERLGALTEAGTQLQITSASIAQRRTPARKLAHMIVERGWATVIASDAHSAEWRRPDLGPGLEAARRAFPHMEREIDWMVSVAPLAIVQGVDLPPRPQRTAAAPGKRLFALGRRSR